jgi:DsbC/DsbD-like thiol-disulfide interchange protein
MRYFMKSTAFSAALLMFGSSFSLASETEWFETDGGNIRLVTAPYMEGASEIRGVIDIQLTDGWKTYWRDPGSGGITPSIEISHTPLVNGVDIHFPVPTWVESEYGDYAGYKEPVQIPFTMELSSPAHDTEINARLMVGICAEICIPAFQDFTIHVEKATGSTRASAIVANAFATLPESPEEIGIKITTEKLEDQGGFELKVQGKLDPQQLFVSSDNNVQFKKPQLISNDSGKSTYFIEPVHALESGQEVKLIVTGRTPQGDFEFNAYKALQK